MLDAMLQIGGPLQAIGSIDAVKEPGGDIGLDFTAMLALAADTPKYDLDLDLEEGVEQVKHIEPISNFIALAEMREVAPFMDEEVDIDTDTDSFTEIKLPVEAGEKQASQVAAAGQKRLYDTISTQEPEPWQVPGDAPIANVIEFPSTEAMLAYEAAASKVEIIRAQSNTQAQAETEATALDLTPAPALASASASVPVPASNSAPETVSATALAPALVATSVPASAPALDSAPAPVLASAVSQVSYKAVSAEPESKLHLQALSTDETVVETESGVEVVRLPVEVEVEAQEVELRNYSTSQPEKGIVQEVTHKNPIAVESFYHITQKSYDHQINGRVADQIQYQVSKALKGENESIKFTLSPQNLGEVEIRFDTERKSGHTNISVLTERYSTLGMLGQITSQIEASLIDSGFKPESFTLNIGMQDGDKGQNKFTQAQGAHGPKEPEMVNYITNYSGHFFASTDEINILV